MKNKLTVIALLFTILIAGCIVPRSARAACITDNGTTVTITCPLYVVSAPVIQPGPPVIVPIVPPVIPPVTPPNTAGYTSLILNKGEQSKTDSLAPGEVKYYTFTIPVGITTFSMNVASLSQTEALDMVLFKGVPPANFDKYYADALVYYSSDIGLSGSAWFKSYPEGLIWTRMGTGFGGQGIYLRASPKNPPVNQAGIAAVIPGTYYVSVKNRSSDASTYASFYVYVNQ